MSNTNHELFEVPEQSKKKGRILTEEQKTTLRERLKKARQTKRDKRAGIKPVPEIKPEPTPTPTEPKAEKVEEVEEVKEVSEVTMSIEKNVEEVEKREIDPRDEKLRLLEERLELLTNIKKKKQLTKNIVAGKKKRKSATDALHEKISSLENRFETMNQPKPQVIQQPKPQVVQQQPIIQKPVPPPRKITSAFISSPWENYFK
jgi:hypothetical protein